MNPAFIAPRSMLARKPKHGAACNQCGLCCVAVLCPLASAVMGRDELPGPCPALIKQDDGAYACGLVVDPLRWAPVRTLIEGVTVMRDAALLLIGAGDGCDARFNGEAQDLDFHQRMIEQDRANGPAREAARRAWGVSP